MHQNCLPGRMNSSIAFLLALTFGPLVLAQSNVPSIKIDKFSQEDPARYVTGAGQPLLDAKHLVIDANARLHVRAGNKQLVLPLKSPAADWQVESSMEYRQANQVLVDGDRTLLATDDGLLAYENGVQSSLSLSGQKVASISVAKDGRIAAATNVGAFEYADGKWNRLVVDDSLGRQWATKDVRVVVYDSKSQLWIGQLAGLVCRTSDGWKFYEGHDGLPYNDFTCAAAGNDGRVWFGTRIGLVGFSDGKFLYREGPTLYAGQ